MPSTAKPSSRPVSKRYRPLGLSIAILATGFTYGLWPVLPLWPVLMSQIFRPASGAIGLELVGGSGIWVGVILGGLIVITCIFAWIGYPRHVRFTLIALVWVATIWQIV